VTDDSANTGRRRFVVSCHALGYARYERTADDLEIPLDLVLANLVFDDVLIGDLIEHSMSKTRFAKTRSSGISRSSAVLS
jgi:hypothetical protein